MLKIPRVALFNPEPDNDAIIAGLFKRHEYGLRRVNSLEEIVELIEDEDSTFDSIVLPLRLLDGSGAAPICLQIKSHPLLSAIPIIALSTSGDKLINQSLYEMGAEVVLAQPFDPDTLFFQIGTLARLRRLHSEQLEEMQQRCESSSAFFRILDYAESGMVVLSPEGKVQHVNTPACRMLGLSGPTPAELDALEQELRPACEEHERNRRTIPVEAASRYRSSDPEFSWRRPDGLFFRGELRIRTLSDERGKPLLHVAALHERVQLQQLEAVLLQAHRERSLGLLSAAASMRLLEAAGGGAPGSLLAGLYSFIDKLPLSCDVASALTRLLEFLDLAIDPGISIKVNVGEEVSVAMRGTDLMQLAGHLILQASEFCGVSGEIVIECSDLGPADGVVVVVSGRSNKELPFCPSSELTALLHTHFETAAPEAAEGKLGAGLATAQTLARKYRSAVQYKQPSDTEIKFRVSLPRARLA